jgi:RNA polymerase sigma-70 factor (ECF subfamily)
VSFAGNLLGLYRVSDVPPETISSTSLSLLERARDNDPDAWRRISRIYGPLVYRWARQAGLQESDAMDLAQEVFAVVSARINDFRHNRPGDSFRGWLWGITSNKVKEFVRCQAANPQAFGGTTAHVRLNELPYAPPEESRAEDLLDTNTGLMHRAIGLIRAEFEEKTWQAFWRATIDERKASEIADELGMTSAAVRQAKCRVLWRLKHEMTNLA